MLKILTAILVVLTVILVGSFLVDAPETEVRVYPETMNAEDTTMARQAVDILLKKCTALRENWPQVKDAVVSIAGQEASEASGYDLRYGWGRYVSFRVTLKSGSPLTPEMWKDDYDISLSVGGGEKPGIAALGTPEATACGLPLTADRARHFRSDEEFAFIR